MTRTERVIKGIYTAFDVINRQCLNLTLGYIYTNFIGAMDPRCKVCIFMGKTDPTAPRHKQQVL